jgi:hypothetical protein
VNLDPHHPFRPWSSSYHDYHPSSLYKVNSHGLFEIPTFFVGFSWPSEEDFVFMFGHSFGKSRPLVASECVCHLFVFACHVDGKISQPNQSDKKGPPLDLGRLVYKR